MSTVPFAGCYNAHTLAVNTTTSTHACYGQGKCISTGSGEYACSCSSGYNTLEQCERPLYAALGSTGVAMIAVDLALFCIFTLLMLFEVFAEFRLQRAKKLVRKPSFYAKLVFLAYCVLSKVMTSFQLYHAVHAVVINSDARSIVSAFTPILYALSYGLMSIEWIRLLITTKELGRVSQRLAVCRRVIYILMAILLPLHVILRYVAIYMKETESYMTHARNAIEAIYILSIFCGTGYYLVRFIPWTYKRRDQHPLFRTVFQKTIFCLLCNIFLILWFLRGLLVDLFVDRNSPDGWKLAQGMSFFTDFGINFGFFMVLQRFFYSPEGLFVSVVSAAKGTYRTKIYFPTNKTGSKGDSSPSASTLSTLPMPTTTLNNESNIRNQNSSSSGRHDISSKGINQATTTCGSTSSSVEYSERVRSTSSSLQLNLARSSSSGSGDEESLGLAEKSS